MGYKNPNDALSKHVEEEDKLVSRIAISGQRRNVNIINESGLYSLILSSQLEQAMVDLECGETAEYLDKDLILGFILAVKDEVK
ncbi:MAG: hypothetical protein J5797_02765 [Prevotella sp.]|nr:hypothetical protein [Prevotella sp.]